MKNHFSKSKYCRLWRCPKILWMDKYKPEEKAEDATDDSRMEAGTEVGKLARELFGKSVDVTETVNGQLDLPAHSPIHMYPFLPKISHLFQIDQSHLKSSLLQFET